MSYRVKDIKSLKCKDCSSFIDYGNHHGWCGVFNFYTRDSHSLTDNCRQHGAIAKSIADDENLATATVTVGVTLITVKTNTIIQDGRAVEIPVDDEIVYTSVPREVAYLPNGRADWNAIADLLEKEGYLRKHYTIQSVWIPVSNSIVDEIF